MKCSKDEQIVRNTQMSPSSRRANLAFWLLPWRRRSGKNNWRITEWFRLFLQAWCGNSLWQPGTLIRTLMSPRSIILTDVPYLLLRSCVYEWTASRRFAFAVISTLFNPSSKTTGDSRPDKRLCVVLKLLYHKSRFPSDWYELLYHLI